MEALFTSLELTISSVQEVSMLIGGILLLIAFVVYMIRSETPKDYLEGVVKIFLMAGGCLYATQFFNFVEDIGIEIATRIDANVTKNPFEIACRILMPPLVEESEEKEEPQAKQPAKEKSGFVQYVKQLVCHPIETGKQIIISGIYGNLMRIIYGLISLTGAVCIMLVIFLQYAVSVILRMFLPIAFACLCVPYLKDKGTTLLMCAVNIACWPIGFAIIQKMIGCLSFDTQITTLITEKTINNFSFLAQGCGLIMIVLLSTLGYLSVPILTSMFVGVKVGTGIMGRVSSFFTGMGGAGLGALGGALGSGLRGVGSSIGHNLMNTSGKAMEWIRAKRSAASRWESSEGWK